MNGKYSRCNTVYASRVAARMKQWNESGCAGPVPSAYADMHQKAALGDMHRFLDSQRCRFAAQGLTDDLIKQGFKVVRVFADCGLTVREFRWSDSLGGCWNEHLPNGSVQLVEKSPDAPGYM